MRPATRHCSRHHHANVSRLLPVRRAAPVPKMGETAWKGVKRSRRTRRSHAVSPQQQHFEALTTSPPMRGSHLRTGRQAARSDSSLASPPSPFGNYFAIYFNSELLQTLARGATAPAGRWGGSRAARRQPMPPRLLRRSSAAPRQPRARSGPRTRRPGGECTVHCLHAPLAHEGGPGPRRSRCPAGARAPEGNVFSSRARPSARGGSLICRGARRSAPSTRPCHPTCDACNSSSLVVSICRGGRGRVLGLCRGLRHLHWARDRLRWRSPWSRLPRGGAMDVAHACLLCCVARSLPLLPVRGAPERHTGAPHPCDGEAACPRCAALRCAALRCAARAAADASPPSRGAALCVAARCAP